MENSVKKVYFTWPPATMSNMLRKNVKFYYFHLGKYKKEKHRDIRKSLQFVGTYQGFTQQIGRVTEVFISNVIVR